MAQCRSQKLLFAMPTTPMKSRASGQPSQRQRTTITAPARISEVTPIAAHHSSNRITAVRFARGQICWKPPQIGLILLEGTLRYLPSLCNQLGRVKLFLHFLCHCALLPTSVPQGGAASKRGACQPVAHRLCLLVPCKWHFLGEPSKTN